MFVAQEPPENLEIGTDRSPTAVGHATASQDNDTATRIESSTHIQILKKGCADNYPLKCDARYRKFVTLMGANGQKYGLIPLILQIIQCYAVPDGRIRPYFYP